MNYKIVNISNNEIIQRDLIKKVKEYNKNKVSDNFECRVMNHDSFIKAFYLNVPCYDYGRFLKHERMIVRYQEEIFRLNDFYIRFYFGFKTIYNTWDIRQKNYGFPVCFINNFIKMTEREDKICFAADAKKIEQ